MSVFRSKYPKAQLDWIEVNGPFSRGLGLSIGAKQFANDSLLFFTDVDIIWTRDVLYRIRLNTVRGKQVYFPIVFSEFAPYIERFEPPSEDYQQHTLNDNFKFSIDNNRGYFRHFGFGLVSIYLSDLDAVGGLTTSIQGWGLEDVDFFEKCLKNSYALSIFRAPEPGLIHIYHSIMCDTRLPSVQYEMCIGSKAANYASVHKLADLFLLYPSRFAANSFK